MSYKKNSNLQAEPRNDQFNNSFCAADQENESKSDNNESNEYVPPDDDSCYYTFPENISQVLKNSVKSMENIFSIKATETCLVHISTKQTQLVRAKMDMKWHGYYLYF